MQRQSAYVVPESRFRNRRQSGGVRQQGRG
jgi:hypothetical protein